MFDLTPAERRGALVLLALVALGACADLWQREPVSAPEPVAAPVSGPAAAAAAPAGSASRPLDLNAATEAELDRLPGIGPVLAGRIAAHREAHGPFRGPEDLLAVPGIGPRLYERLRPLVTAGAPGARAERPLQIARRPSK